MGKELWLTFYDIEKCFDSLWLEDRINSLWDLGVKDDFLCLIYLMNIKATVTIKTPLEDTDPLFLSNFVKQGTVLGPVLSNCSLNKLSTDSIGYDFGSVQIKSMGFADDLADPNRDKQSALASNAVLEAIQHEKWLTFSAEKCELLKINSKRNTCLKVNGRSMKQVDVASYLGDHSNHQKPKPKAKTRMLDIKINYKRKCKNSLHCPFCSEYDETFESIFKCTAGLRIPKQQKDFTLQSVSMMLSGKFLEKLGYFLGKYNKYRQVVICQQT